MLHLVTKLNPDRQTDALKDTGGRNFCHRKIANVVDITDPGRNVVSELRWGSFSGIHWREL